MKTELFVNNLTLYVTKETIANIFAIHGSVASVDLVTNRSSARSRGFAFVTMGTEEGARKAIAALNGSLDHGRLIRVVDARPLRDGNIPRQRPGPRREFRKLY